MIKFIFYSSIIYIMLNGPSTSTSTWPAWGLKPKTCKTQADLVFSPKFSPRVFSNYSCCYCCLESTCSRKMSIKFELKLEASQLPPWTVNFLYTSHTQMSPALSSWYEAHFLAFWLHTPAARAVYDLWLVFFFLPTPTSLDSTELSEIFIQ